MVALSFGRIEVCVDWFLWVWAEGGVGGMDQEE